jgi:hypothetical protein
MAKRALRVVKKFTAPTCLISGSGSLSACRASLRCSSLSPVTRGTASRSDAILSYSVLTSAFSR